MAPEAHAGGRAPHAFFDVDRPLVFAHRGGAALAPENTLAAFDQAVRMGVDGLELDLHRTADGHLVACHDPTVDRTTDGIGWIRDLPLAALRELDAGYAFSPDGGRTFPFRGRGVRIPTFAEILTRYERVRLGAELKSADVPSAQAAVAAAASAGALARVCLGAFEALPVRWLRRRHPELATYATSPEVRRFLVRLHLRLGRLAAPRADAFCVPERSGRTKVVTPALVRVLGRHGIPVHVWTVDDVADMRRLLAWGVMGLVTDRPDRALAVRG